MRRYVLTFLLILALAVSAPAFAADAQPVGAGLVLTADLPKDAVLQDNGEDANGYTERLTTADGLANIVLLRRGGSVSADELMKELYPDAAGVATVDQPPIAAYPAVRETFSLGANEDSRAGVLVAFSTDAFTFAFAADAALDSYEGEEGYKGIFDTWIASLDLIDG